MTFGAHTAKKLVHLFTEGVLGAKTVQRSGEEAKPQINHSATVWRRQLNDKKCQKGISQRLAKLNDVCNKPPHHFILFSLLIKIPLSLVN